MTKNQLRDKRFIPAINKMYEKAQCICKLDKLYTFDELCKFSSGKPYKDNLQHFPYSAFYLDEKTYMDIKKEAIKGMHYSWSWPYRSEILLNENEIIEIKKRIENNDKNTEFLKKRLELNDIYVERENLWKTYRKEKEELDSKGLKGNEYKKANDELSQKYNMTKRSRDAESIEFSLSNYSPNSNKDIFEVLKTGYAMLMDKLNDTFINDDEKIEEYATDIISCFFDKSIDEFQLSQIKYSLINSYWFIYNTKNNNKKMKF